MTTVVLLVGVLAACDYESRATQPGVLEPEASADDSIEQSTPAPSPTHAESEEDEPTETPVPDPTPTPIDDREVDEQVEPTPTATASPESVGIRMETETENVRDDHGLPPSEEFVEIYRSLKLLWAEISATEAEIAVVFATEESPRYFDEVGDFGTWTVTLASEEERHEMTMAITKRGPVHTHGIYDRDGDSVPDIERRHHWESSIDNNVVTITIDREKLGDFPEEFTWFVSTSSPYFEGNRFGDTIPYPRSGGLWRVEELRENHASYPLDEAIDEPVVVRVDGESGTLKNHEGASPPDHLMNEYQSLDLLWAEVFLDDPFIVIRFAADSPLKYFSELGESGQWQVTIASQEERHLFAMSVDKYRVSQHTHAVWDIDGDSISGIAKPRVREGRRSTVTINGNEVIWIINRDTLRDFPDSFTWMVSTRSPFVEGEVYQDFIPHRTEQSELWGSDNSGVPIEEVARIHAEYP